MQKYSDIARPQRSVLRKHAEPDRENPTDEKRQAFENLKTRLISPLILALPKAGRPYIIDKDTSAYRLGATPLQQQNEENANEWIPIGYWSKTLTGTERNYSTTKRECYSVVWSVTTLRPYIEGLTFTIRKDNDALRWLMTISDSTGRIMCWRLLFSEFVCTGKYRPGLVHQVSNAPSSVLTPEGIDEKQIDDEVPKYGDQEAVVVKTRRKAANFTPNLSATTARKRTTRKRTPRTPTEAGRMNMKDTANLTNEERLITDFQQNNTDHNTKNDVEAIEDVLEEDLNIFDMALACQDDGRVLSIAEVPANRTKGEVLEAPVDR